MMPRARHRNYIWSHKPGKCVSQIIGYGHYHDGTNTFHIWYGDRITYYNWDVILWL